MNRIKYRISRKKYHFVKLAGVWTCYAPTSLRDCNRYSDDQRRAINAFFRKLIEA